jgi:hypothetical protein
VARAADKAARTSSSSEPPGRSASWRCRRRSSSAPARVVAAGRSAAGLERALEHGADATLHLGGGDDLVAFFKDAFDGEGPNYVFDPLWGEPAAAAVTGCRALVDGREPRTVGGGDLELASAAVRFKSLSILGHTNYAVPPGELADHYGRLVRHVLAGRSGSRSNGFRWTRSRMRGADRRKAPGRSSSSFP